MEAAIRWSSQASAESQRFLIADVVGNSLRHYQVRSLKGDQVESTLLSSRDKLPNYTAFDWSRNDQNLVAIATGLGETKVIKLNASDTSEDLAFPIRQQRKCNSVAFNTKHLLAAAYDKHRNDASLNVYDIRNSGPNAEPHRRLANSDIVINVKFFAEQPEILLAGLLPPKGAALRLYDLREASSIGMASFATRHCHFLSIDPLDENYFASAGPAGDNVVSVWDRRLLTSSSAANLSTVPSPSSVMEIRPAIDTTSTPSIWSLRYSGYRRGCFAILSSAGQVRLFETARYPVEQEGKSDELFTAVEDVTCYAKKVHELKRPVTNSSSAAYRKRTIAFDAAGAERLISIRHDKSIELIGIPSTPPLARMSPLSQMAMFVPASNEIIGPKKIFNIADDLLAVQAKISHQLESKSDRPSSPKNGTGRGSALTSAIERSRISEKMGKASSRDRHEQLLMMGGDSVRLELHDLLTVQDAQRRRCDEGYLFDCERNKEILKNDPWLVDMWDVIKRLEDMANNGGMIYDALDLSYLGVNDIWNSRVGSHASRITRAQTSLSEKSSTPDFGTAISHILARQGYEIFKGAETDYPLQRQVSLAICGWRFSEKKLRSKCEEISERGEHYKAITVAVCHGRKDVAIDLLKTATRRGVVENGGLAAVIAGDGLSKEQRSLCEWMAEDARDPYLKALLTHFVTGDWSSVIAMVELPLVYRVALALKYLSDAHLDAFLSEATSDAIANGDTEGIVLTGLAEDSMDLFQNYVAKSSDLQTAVLATARTNPRYVQDERWQAWKEEYFWQMQAWRAFIPRSRFTSQHNRMAVTRDGQRLIKPPPRQVALRCNYCQSSIARNSLDDAADTVTLSSAGGVAGGSMLGRNKSPAPAAGTVCPRCSRPMPRCAICMLWLGSPDPSRPAGAAALNEVTEEDPMAKMVVFCMGCNHGYHGNHAKMWFAKHDVCSVPDCSCLCAIRGGV